MTKLALYFLGAPQIEIDGRVAEPDTRKALALIAYLAITGERHTRDTLAALLWPEYDQKRSRAALRRTLSALKSSLDGYGLLIDRESLALDGTANVYIDVNEFRQEMVSCNTHGRQYESGCQVCLDHLSKAVALYRGPFMAGFTLRDAVTFDEWQYLQGDSVNRELATALQALIRCHLHRHHYSVAITFGQQLLELDPLHEPAHRQLMIAYARSGRRSSALRQYRECVRILDEELGVPPLEETTALYEQIVRGEIREQDQAGAGVVTGTMTQHEPQTDLPPATTEIADSRHRHAMPETLPIVGRAPEWEQLNRALNINQEDGRLVVLKGEAGIGKTRLAQAKVEAWRQDGGSVLRVQCFAGESGLAYGPIIEGLRNATQLADPDWYSHVTPFALAECSRLLPEYSQIRSDLPALPPLDSLGAQSRFFEGVRHVMLSLAGQHQPQLLFVDDIHWADEATTELLAYLARRLKGRPLSILLTWRSEDAISEHQIYQALTDGQRSGLLEVIPLQRLTLDAVQDLVTAVMSEYEDVEGLAQQLFIETEGLPFFLAEYLVSLGDELSSWREMAMPGTESELVPGIRRTSGTRSSRRHLPIPGGVRDLIQSRLATLSDTGRQLLQTASIFGRSFDFDTLRIASGRTEEETITALEELIKRALVEERQLEEAQPFGLETTVAPVPQYDFSHEKVRALVYDQVSLARRRLLHRRAAQALAERPELQASNHSMNFTAATIAYHYQLGGQDQTASEYYKLAGDAARMLYANKEALNHYLAALALGNSDTMQLRELIADLYILRGEYNQALSGFEAAAAEADRNSESAAIGRIEHKIGTVYNRLGEWDLAANHFETSLKSISESIMQSRLFADWSLTAHRAGQDEQATSLAEEALRLAENAQDDRALAQAHNILGILSNSRGDPNNASWHLQQGLKLAQSLDDPVVHIAVTNNLSRVLGVAGEIDNALTMAKDALEMCLAMGDRHHAAALYSNLADLLHAGGRSEEAMGYLKQAAVIYAEIGGDQGEWRPEIWKLDAW